MSEKKAADKRSIAKKIAVLPVLFYQYSISPLFPPSCRFKPTCSEYMKDAIHKHGVFRGFWLGLIRFSKCHPWGGSGFDPVP